MDINYVCPDSSSLFDVYKEKQKCVKGKETETKTSLGIFYRQVFL